MISKTFLYETVHEFLPSLLPSVFRRDRPLVGPLRLCLVRLPGMAVPLRPVPRLRLPPPHQAVRDPAVGEACGQEVGRLRRVPRLQEEDARPDPLPKLRWPRGASITVFF